MEEGRKELNLTTEQFPYTCALYTGTFYLFKVYLKTGVLGYFNLCNVSYVKIDLSLLIFFFILLFYFF